MREQLDRFGPWAICAVLGWVAYSGVSATSSEKKSERAKLPLVAADALARRGADETLPSFRDPFHADWAPYGREWAPEVLAEQRRLQQEAEAAAVRAENEAEAARRKAKQEAELRRRNAGPASITLRLDAVTRLPDSDVALVCGRSVRVGEPIPGHGEPAPVLVRCDGESVDVAWRGGTWTVRLGEEPRTVVPPAAEPDADPAQGQGTAAAATDAAKGTPR